MATAVPQVIGKYKILGEIARGGMGVVYKAVHPSLKREVIIKKMIARGNKTEALRFEQEAKILLDLQNPYIVHLHDYFVEGGYRYMVEELVDGMAVDKLLKKQGVLSSQAALVIILYVCYALRYAHSKNIVHRDIKGGNILISKKCEIKLADFGIASEKSEDSLNEEGITQNGAVIGTPSYMPPEQFENSATVDNRADIYALGVLLYELVTGQKPYQGSLTLEMLKIIKHGKYPSPQKIVPATPLFVVNLIHKMMAPKAKNRFRTVEPIIKKITHYLKSFDEHEIRVSIAKMVISPSKVVETKYKEKSKLPMRIAQFTALGVAAIMFFTFSWKNGYIHRYVLRPMYTPIEVKVALPNRNGRAMDIPVFAYFFKNDAKKIPLVAQTVIQSSKSKAKDKKSDGELVSSPVYLRHGEYRVKLAAGSYVWWQNFIVTKKSVTIVCDFLRDIKRPIRVLAQAYDHNTGDDITRISRVEVFYKGSWVPLASLGRDKIMNDVSWRFRFSAPGYESEEFSLAFDWYQDEVHIGATLKPKQK